MTDLLPNAPREFRFTVAEIVASMQRELSYRTRVYERRVADKKMSQAEADKQIAFTHAWIAIAQTLPMDRVFVVPAP